MHSGEARVAPVEEWRPIRVFDSPDELDRHWVAPRRSRSGLKQGCQRGLRYCELELTYRRQVVKIVWRDGAFCEAMNADHLVSPGDLRIGATFNETDERLRAVEGVSELALRPPFLVSPFRQSHNAAPIQDQSSLHCNLQYILASHNKYGPAEYNQLSLNVLVMRPGNRLRELRKTAELTQQELADVTGVSQAAISQLENGERSMDLAWMRTFARALACAPADLLTDDDNPDRLAPKERSLVGNYRSANEQQRELVERVASPTAAYRAAPKHEAA